MKKIFIVMILLLTGSMCFADCDYKCPTAYDLTSGTSQFFSKATGQNFLAEKIGEKLTKKAIKKNITSGDIKVNLDSYSVRDLKAGRFKSLEITGKDVNMNGIYISNFKAKTLCDFNYVQEDKNDNIIIKEDIPVGIEAEITQDDLNKTMNSSDYKRMINDINSIGANFNFFQISSTSVKLKNDKMYYIMKYSMPFVRKSQEIIITADLNVKNGQITLANTNILNNNFALDVNKFSKLLNYVNPLDFSAKVLENKNAKFNVQELKINEGKITVYGIMTVLKDKE